jgi:hypothetical protein
MMSYDTRKIQLIEETAALLEGAQKARRNLLQRRAPAADIEAADHLVDSVMVFSQRLLAEVDPARVTERFQL